MKSSSKYRIIRRTKRYHRSSTRRHKQQQRGAGNFLTPRTQKECYSHLFTDIDVKKQFAVGPIKDNALFENLSFDKPMGQGGYNIVRTATGTNKCLLTSVRSLQGHPLLFRYSKRPINQFRKTSYKEKYKGDIDRYMKDAIQAYQNEMLIQVDLSTKGIMPFIYMCGSFEITSSKYRNIGNIGDVFTFTIMEKFGASVDQVLKNPTYRSSWQSVIRRVCNLYGQLARQNICNVDVKPGNVVISFREDSGQIDRIALIDMDADFNVNIGSYDRTLSSNLMKIAFLLHVQEHAESNELVEFVRQELNQFSMADVMDVRYIVYEDGSIKYAFDHYHLLAAMEELYNKRMQRLKNPDLFDDVSDVSTSKKDDNGSKHRILVGHRRIRTSSLFQDTPDTSSIFSIKKPRAFSHEVEDILKAPAAAATTITE